MMDNGGWKPAVSRDYNYNEWTNPEYDMPYVEPQYTYLLKESSTCFSLVISIWVPIIIFLPSILLIYFSFKCNHTRLPLLNTFSYSQPTVPFVCTASSKLSLITFLDFSCKNVYNYKNIRSEMKEVGSHALFRSRSKKTV